MSLKHRLEMDDLVRSLQRLTADLQRMNDTADLILLHLALRRR